MWLFVALSTEKTMKEQNISCNLNYLVYLLFSLNFCDEELKVCVGKDTGIHNMQMLHSKRLDRWWMCGGVWIERIDCVQKVRVLLLFLLWVLLQSCKKLQSFVESL